MTEELKPAHEVLVNELEDLVEQIRAYVESAGDDLRVAPAVIYLRECRLLCRVLARMVIPAKHIQEVYRRISLAAGKLSAISLTGDFQFDLGQLTQTINVRMLSAPAEPPSDSVKN